MAPASTPPDHAAESSAAVEHDDPDVAAARDAEAAAYDEYGFAPTEHLIEIDALDCRIRVLEVGDGPPVVLVPGGEGMGLSWLPLLPALEGYTRYVMDRPGGGLSDPFDHRRMPLRENASHSMAGLVDHFGFDAVPFVANSMGGLWTLRFAQANPDRVASIALLGTPALYPGTSAPLPMRFGSIPWLTGVVVDRALRPASPHAVREGLSFMGHPAETRKRPPDVLMEAMYRMTQLPRYRLAWIGILQRALRLRGAAPEERFTAADLEGIEHPVTLAWGREDPFGSVQTGRAGAQHFPNATFHVVGQGHLPWLDAPERCAELIRESHSGSDDPDSAHGVHPSVGIGEVTG